jgi:8-oxo-dGTP pyrophosphatase MutT (NUDIX family)
LQAYEATEKPAPGFRSAAVNIILFSHSSPYLILTKRATHLQRHSGQIALPGGAEDDADSDLWATACRETEEEIGIDLQALTMLGRLDTMLTNSSYSVTPFVSVYGDEYPIRYRPDRNEIEYVLEVPIACLLDPENLSLLTFGWQQEKYIIPHFWYAHEVIWGVTGFILYNFLRITNLLPDLGRLPEPGFA